MHKHLQAFVLAHIIYHVLVHRTCIFRRYIIQSQHHSLLILRYQLRLSRICLTGYTWRQHIVHRCTIRIFLYIHSLHIQRTRTCVWIAYVVLVIRHILIQTFAIIAPLTTYKIQGCQTNMSFLIKTCQKHTSKTN